MYRFMNRSQLTNQLVHMYMWMYSTQSCQVHQKGHALASVPYVKRKEVRYGLFAQRSNLKSYHIAWLYMMNQWFLWKPGLCTPSQPTCRTHFSQLSSVILTNILCNQEPSDGWTDNSKTVSAAQTVRGRLPLILSPDFIWYVHQYHTWAKGVWDQDSIATSIM